MKRVYEELSHSVVFAPGTVAAGTEQKTSFVDASNVPEVEFLISTGALASGKQLTASVYTAADAAGTDAVKAGEAVFTAEDDSPCLAAVSYRAAAEGGRYVGLGFKHDAAAAVVCGVTASVRSRELPAANGWTLVV